MEESVFRSVRNIWMEGGTTYCISLPFEIVKKLQLDQNSLLYVELVDDLIVMKKNDTHFTNTDIQKVQSNMTEVTTKSIKKIDEDDDNNTEEESDNPLKDLKL